MKKEKYIWNFVSAILLLFYGAVFLCSSIFSFHSIRYFFLVFFLLYGVLKLAVYFLENRRDFISLFMGLVGIFFSVINWFWDFFLNPRNLAFMLLSFALCISFLKLKKADLFHDHKSSNWIVEMIGLIFFLLFHVFVCLHLSYSEDILFVILGFYIFGIGLFEFYEAFIYSITDMKGKRK